jgi:hypothetical protein
MPAYLPSTYRWRTSTRRSTERRYPNARRLVEPTPIEDVGSFALLQDPEGNVAGYWPPISRSAMSDSTRQTSASVELDVECGLGGPWPAATDEGLVVWSIATSGEEPRS